LFLIPSKNIFVKTKIEMLHTTDKVTHGSTIFLQNRETETRTHLVYLLLKLSPHSAIADPHSAATEHHSATADPHSAIADPHSAIADPHSATANPSLNNS
jgi:hypothetical protein